MRVPVVDHKNKPLMPTTPSRARRWVKDGKAVKRWSKLGVFYVQLVKPPSGYKKQDIAVGLDPGKLYSGVAVQSAKCTLLMLHIELPFKTVKARMEQRAMMRRSRRGRRIDRKQPFKERAHRQKRFANRRNSKLPPSINANKRLELRVLRLLTQLYPISHIVIEQIKARGDKGFSPAMVGQVWQLEKLVQAEKFFGFKISTKFGWETSQLRQHLGLPKDKQDKSRQIPATHAVDGIALACTRWMQYGVLSPTRMGWRGNATVTPAVFVIVKRPPYSRRQLHLMVPALAGGRRKYGGSVTRHGFRKGDYVEAIQGSKTYRGWVSGDTEKQISVSDANWKRLSQFAKNKVRLIRRSTGLIVIASKYKAVL
ncbi:MAG: RRXRR domain-containing protein [Tolypothrix carrinoi HA7290-LM1]|jgi:hypothetical protein|nr:RRXRR domain-containing protein [Tolypothrix carrinoi HA7290-LM1]